MPDKDLKSENRIRGLRIAKGLSIADVSQQSGIAESTLYSIEGHMISPPLGNLVSLAKVFEVSVGDFFGDSGDSPYCIVRSGDRKTVSRFNSTDGKSGGYSYRVPWSTEKKQAYGTLSGDAYSHGILPG